MFALVVGAVVAVTVGVGLVWVRRRCVRPAVYQVVMSAYLWQPRKYK